LWIIAGAFAAGREQREVRAMTYDKMWRMSGCEIMCIVEFGGSQPVLNSTLVWGGMLFVGEGN